MSLFGSIMDKIFHHKPAAAAPAPAAMPAQPHAPVPAPAPAPAPTPTPGPAPASAQPVDVEAVLTGLAATKGGGGNWRTSIVDLLKLLDLDSSAAARHGLAEELGVTIGADGSAERNTALHRAVMRKLAENGGTVPASLRD